MNKKIIFIYIVFSILFIGHKNADSQIIDQGDYNGVTIKYAKHIIQGWLNLDSISNQTYMNNVNNFLSSINAEIDTIYLISKIPDSSGIYVMTMINLLNDTMDALNYISIIQNAGFFHYVQPCFVTEGMDFPHPNDPRFEDQTYLYQERDPGQPNHDIDADKAWVITKGSTTNSRIYIVDSGIRCLAPAYTQIHHEDLIGGNIVLGTDYTPDPNLNDGPGHGTRIAGLVGATQNNSLGITGVAPGSRTIIDKIRRENGSGFVSYITNSLNAIVDFKILNPNIGIVVNMSNVWLTEDLGFVAALNRARTNNVTMVCGSGNYPTVPDHLVAYPARYANTYENVISVGAVDEDDEITDYSCYGRPGTQEVTLCAPGGLFGLGAGLWTTSNTAYDAYTADFPGTSFSAPLVAATVGLMLSVKNNLTSAQIKNKIIRSVEKVAGMNGANYTLEYGYGRLNAFNAVSNSLDSVTNIFGAPNQTITLSDNLRIEDLTTIPERCTIIVPTGKVIVLDRISNLQFESFAKIIVQDGGTIIQRMFATVEDRGEILLQNGSNYYIEEDGDINLAGQGPGGPTDYGCLAIWGGTLHIQDNSTVRMQEGGFLTIRNGGKLILGKNSNIIFGGTSWLELSEGSSIVFGENSGIKFRGSSYIYADTEDTSHIYFSGINAETRWNGIIFDSSLVNDTIERCVFSGAKTAITIRNNAISSNVTRIFEDNIFNIPEGLDYKGIFGTNTHKITIEGNVFNMTTTVGVNSNIGIYLKNENTSSVPVGDPEGASEDPENTMVYILNIVHNTFNKGTASIVLANFTANFLPYYIKSNTFGSPASQMNIFGIKIGGTIKDNIMTSMQTPMGIHLANSNPTLFNNIIPARDVALHLVGNCYPNLAPQISGNQTTWTGGKNQLSVNLFDAVQLAAPGNVFTDYGRNKFLAPASGYHMYGWIDSTVEIYKSRNNCWYRPGNTIANIYLVKPNTLQPVSTITYNYVFDCTSEPNPIEYELDYMGHEIWDSVMISENDIGAQPDEDEQLFMQAMDYYRDNQFINSIVTYKSIIDNFPSSNFVSDALYDMYACHEALDTSSNEDYINTLFGNLNIYLSQKIESDSYDTQFEDIAFDIILMCESKLENYNDAMNGYEFTALFHPDPNIRLIASWNFAAVEAILNSGSGGGHKDIEITIEDLFEKKIAEIEKNVSEDPVMQKMKKSFEIVSKQRSDLIEKQINNSSKNVEESNSNLRKANELDKFKEDKARRNLFVLKNLNNEELEKVQLEDLFLTSRDFRNESSIEGNTAIPGEYKLSQNYPNPFNPSTTIKYELPFDGFVKIKIFDLIGREIVTLVNESKQAGSYQVLFNGQNFASGVYFYKIEVGSFVETKRMVLIK